MKHYIIHNDALTERRKSLQLQLDKFKLADIEWVTTFPVTDPIVTKIKEFTKSLLPIEHVSCSLKHYDALYRILKDGVPEAIIFEDDVIISEFYDEQEIVKYKYPYIKLGRGPPDCQVPLGSALCIHPNPGGSEAYYVTLDFAREYLNNVNVGWGLDVEQYAFLTSENLSLVCLPICYQEFNVSFEYPDIKFPITWVEFIQKYVNRSLPRFTYEQLLKV